MSEILDVLCMKKSLSILKQTVGEIFTISSKNQDGKI